MNISQELKQLLKEKEELFCKVERISNDIFDAPVDQINALLETRGKTLEQVIQTDNRIKPLVSEDAYLKSILDCTCDISSLPEEMKELFENSLHIKSIANRIIKNQDGIRLRIENERDMLLKNIEDMNHSSKTVAESYKRSVETGLSQTFGSNKKKKV